MNSLKNLLSEQENITIYNRIAITFIQVVVFMPIALILVYALTQ